MKEEIAISPIYTKQFKVRGKIKKITVWKPKLDLK